MKKKTKKKRVGVGVLKESLSQARSRINCLELEVKRVERACGRLEHGLYETNSANSKLNTKLKNYENFVYNAYVRPKNAEGSTRP